MSIGLLANKRLRRILVLVIASFLAIVVVLSVLFYQYTIRNFEQSELMRLKGISNAIALQIDGDNHEAMMNKYLKEDEITSSTQDSIYLGIHNTLKKNFDANMLSTPIYTLVRSADDSHYEFGVTSLSEPYYRHKYKTFPPSLLEMYETGDMIEAYTDEYGMWLSAFTPIKNKDGKHIAIVMVDLKLEDFLSATRTHLWKVIGLSVAIFLLMCLGLLYFLRGILKKENDFVNSLTKSNAENAKIKNDLAIINQQLSSSSEYRKEMVANISHDLRNALSNVIGYIELLKDKKYDSDIKQEHFLNVANKEANRLKHMVDELFELSILESTKPLLNKEVFNMAELISDVVQKYNLPIREKKVELGYDIDESVGLVIGDVKYIERVFQNLLDNAVKFVKEGGFIKLSLLKGYDNKALIKVCNVGDPIKEEDRAHIFERYFKKPNEYGGTGLGLAIAKKICDLHGCEIFLDVTGNVNSFYFTVETYKPENIST